jgi:hypothetical protein
VGSLNAAWGGVSDVGLAEATVKFGLHGLLVKSEFTKLDHIRNGLAYGFACL